jgi:hypothetical protein
VCDPLGLVLSACPNNTAPTLPITSTTTARATTPAPTTSLTVTLEKVLCTDFDSGVLVRGLLRA